MDIRITKTKNISSIMSKYLGVLLIVLGAIILLTSYFMELVDYNFVQFGAFGLMVVGLIAHIFIQKREK